MRKLFLIVAASFFVFSATAISASATTLNSVRDLRGNPVLDSRKNCVRHDWEEKSDVCGAPEPAPAPQPAPAPVVQEVAPVSSPAKQLKVEDRTVYFEFDKSGLTDEARTKLNSLADVLKSDTEVKSASIVGFADQMGKDNYNLKLSEKRAVEVQNYLAEKGFVKTDLAKTEWVGSAESKTDCSKSKKRNAKIKCLASDRKVEVRINFEQ